jgi:hypothetical protein
MLQALKNYSPSERERILSKVVLKLLPNPVISENLGTLEDEEIRKQILAEIVPAGKPAQEALPRLSKEISELAFSRADQREIKDRLGQKGFLPIDSYSIGYRPYAKENERMFGIRRKHVENAIKQSDLCEHLLPEKLFESHRFEAFSLFVKTHVTRQPRDTFSLLVFACRSKAHLEVIDAWRLYHSEVDLSEATTALAVLKAFTEKYGKPIAKNGGKFVLYSEWPLSTTVIENKPIRDYFFVSQGSGVDTKIERRYWFAREDRNVLQIAFAFVLRMDKYRSDLEMHPR